MRTNAESEDIIVSTMSDIGLGGAEIEDKVPLSGRELEELFVDEAPLPVIEDDNGEEDLACLNFYVEIAEPDANRAGDGLKLIISNEEEPVTPEEVLTRMREELDSLRQYSDIGEGTVTVSVTEDIDWRDNWKQYFHKFTIDDVLVLPSWEEMGEEDQKSAAYVLHMDPGAAFGTGLHETTKLAVRALRRVIDSKKAGREAGGLSVLDIGTGSGVLSILSLMFGADFAVGVDLDPLACSAAIENRDRNGYSGKEMDVFQGDLIRDEAFRAKISGVTSGYSIVVANILPNVLLPLTPVVPSLMEEKGVLIYSGILISKADEVILALSQAGFSLQDREELGEWCALTAVR